MVSFGASAKWRAWMLLGLLVGCGDGLPGSESKNIFREDIGDPQRGSAARRQATPEERLWTVSLQAAGSLCTGALLSPEHLLTANHCRPRVGTPYTSGHALNQNRRGDLVITELLDQNPTYDFTIAKIRWTAGSMPPEMKFPPLIATKRSDVNYSREKDRGDEMFTVGFSADKLNTWGATYSEGRAKEYGKPRGFPVNLMFYNLGTINGNSGGSVYRKSDKMLVTMTNAGPQQLNQPGWNSGSKDDASNWNNGVAMWDAYEASRVLREIFPNGRNRYAQTGGGDPGQGNGRGQPGDLADRLKIALGAPDRSADATFTLGFAAPRATAEVIFCAVARPEDCREGAAGYTRATYVRGVGDVAVFRAQRPTALSSGLVLSVVAIDNAGARTAGKAFRIDAQ